MADLNNPPTVPTGAPFPIISDIASASPDLRANEGRALVLAREALWHSRAEVADSVKSKLLALGMPLLSEIDSAPLPVALGGKFSGWTYAVALDYTTGEHHAALIFGNIAQGSLADGKDVPLRLHSSSKLADIFFGLNSDSSGKFDAAMQQIQERGRGVILYIEHDGRGHGVLAQAKMMNARFRFETPHHIVPNIDASTGQPISVAEAFRQVGYESDGRCYAVSAEFLRKLGVSSAELLSGNREKAQQLASFGIEVRLATSGEKFQANSKEDATENGLSAAQVVAAERARAEMDAHCAKVKLAAHTPWLEVERNIQLLKEIGAPLAIRLSTAPLPTKYGDWTVSYYGDLTTGEIHRVLVYGDQNQGALGSGEDVLMRIHSACKTNEIYHATNCECQAELALAMRQVQSEGRGVIVYLDQEGRGTGITGKLAQLREMFQFDASGKVVERLDEATGSPVQTADAYIRAGYPPEIRNFSVVGAILADLGIQSAVLLSNNPRKLGIFTDLGIPCTGRAIVVPASDVADPAMIQRELKNKAAALGHAIDEEQLRNGGYCAGH